MSMREYPLHDYGLLLSPELVALISLYDWDAETTRKEIREILDGTHPESHHVKYNFWEVVDLLRDNNIEVVTCSEFDGSAQPIKAQWKAPDTRPFKTGVASWEWDNGRMGYIPLENRPELFENAPYPDPEAVEHELEEKLFSFIPDTVSIRPWIVEIEGTYFC